MPHLSIASPTCQHTLNSTCPQLNSDLSPDLISASVSPLVIVTASPIISPARNVEITCDHTFLLTPIPGKSNPLVSPFDSSKRVLNQTTSHPLQTSATVFSLLKWCHNRISWIYFAPYFASNSFFCAARIFFFFFFKGSSYHLTLSKTLQWILTSHRSWEETRFLSMICKCLPHLTLFCVFSHTSHTSPPCPRASTTLAFWFFKYFIPSLTLGPLHLQLSLPSDWDDLCVHGDTHTYILICLFYSSSKSQFKFSLLGWSAAPTKSWQVFTFSVHFRQNTYLWLESCTWGIVWLLSVVLHHTERDLRLCLLTVKVHSTLIYIILWHIIKEYAVNVNTAKSTHYAGKSLRGSWPIHEHLIAQFER